MTESAKARAGVSRRQCLKLWAASAGSLAVLSAAPATAAASAPPDAGQAAAVLIDVTRCVGCKNCERACNGANNLHPTPEEENRLSAQTYTFVDQRQVQPDLLRTIKRQCMHCSDPACVAACTVGALQRTAGGPVVADTGKCIGCRYCQYACPFGVPQFEWQKALGVVRKCTSCADRLAQGQAPACTTACPSGALKFGQRQDLLQQAHARLQAHPESYVNHVYGEYEVGGTSRLYISDVPFAQLGLPALDTLPAPHYAEQVMARTPAVAVSVAAACTGIYSFLRWRQKDAAKPAIQVEEQER